MRDAKTEKQSKAEKKNEKKKEITTLRNVDVIPLHSHIYNYFVRLQFCPFCVQMGIAQETRESKRDRE